MALGEVAAVTRGKSRDIIQQLVSCDFTRQHLHNCFCTGCRRVFCSWLCDNHHRHHELDDFQLINIIRQDGLLLIHEEQLPSDLTKGVKRVKLDDGRLGVPLKPRCLTNSSAATKCDRDNCEEATEEGEVCSIYCRVHV